MKEVAEWDADARRLATGVAQMLRSELGADLLGVCVHGSLAMGCYYPPKADVDMLAVVNRPLPVEQRRLLHRALLDLHDRRGTGAGLEMSIVTADAAGAAAHPMPYELHFGSEVEFTDAIRNGTLDYAAGQTDADLAAHITVARQRGIALFGPSPAAIFAPIPWAHYVDALATDLDWALAPERLGSNPVYFILNACRVLQIDRLGEGTIASKEEGALWGMAAFPQYRVVIEAALAHYRSAEAEGTARFDAAVTLFVDFVRRQRVSNQR